MTAWVLRRTAGGRSSGEGLKGTAQEPVLPYAVAHYERLAWYGNSLVQLSLVLGFCLFFVAGCLSWPAGFLRRRLRPAGTPEPTQIVSGLAQALCTLNLVLLAGLVVLVQAVSNQIRPACPPALRLLPLAGGLSALLTVVLVAFTARAWRSGVRMRGRWWWAFIALAEACFLPFLSYWDLLGTPF